MQPIQDLAALVPDAVHDTPGDGAGDRILFLRHFDAPGEDPVQRREQIHRLMPVFVLPLGFRQRLGQLGIVEQAHLGGLSQLRRHLFDGGEGVLGLELFQGLEQYLQLGDLLLVRGEQGAGLEIQQVGRHLHEFAGDLQIHALHLVQPGQILVGDLGDADIADLDFILLKQHQDQAQGALEILQLVALMHNRFQMKVRVFHSPSGSEKNLAQVKGGLGDGKQGVIGPGDGLG